MLRRCGTVALGVPYIEAFMNVSEKWSYRVWGVVRIDIRIRMYF